MRSAVIICIWKRPGMLQETIADLNAQGDTDFDLVIWDNSGGAWAARRDTELRQFGGTLEVVESPHNIGGFARFVAANDLARAGYDHVIFLDDDQRVRPGFVATMKSEVSPRVISGWWAWKIRDRSYLNRFRPEIGEICDYIGTGGMSAPSSIFTDEFITSFPEEFKPVEDVYLGSYFKLGLGGELVRSAASVGFKPGHEDHSSWRELVPLKNRCYTWCLDNIEPADGIGNRT